MVVFKNTGVIIGPNNLPRLLRLGLLRLGLRRLGLLRLGLLRLGLLRLGLPHSTVLST